ncbi:MAG: sigma-70 family RNA polymerase sigma factor [Nitrosomonas sp.]|nr:MAG: sigma-70 family RNA polymerase sigma factor [Nitrosomonas sp.]
MSVSTPSSAPIIEILHNDHHSWLRGWLRKRLGNAFDAADIAHDTYVRIIASGNIPTPDQSRCYLTQIANGLVIDLYRRRQIETAYLEAIQLLPNAEAPAEEMRAQVIEALIEIDTILHNLPRKVRAALLLCKIDGLSYREIAEQLHVSMSSVEKYIALGLRACYQVMYESRN